MAKIEGIRHNKRRRQNKSDSNTRKRIFHIRWHYGRNGQRVAEKDNSFCIDKELRKTNNAIVDSVLKNMERKKRQRCEVIFRCTEKKKKCIFR